MLDEQRERLLSTSHSGQREAARHGHATIRRFEAREHAPAHELAMGTQLVALAALRSAAPLRLEQVNGHVAGRLSGFRYDEAPLVFELRSDARYLIWRGELLDASAAQVARRHGKRAKEVAIANRGEPQPAST